MPETNGQESRRARGHRLRALVVAAATVTGAAAFALPAHAEGEPPAPAAADLSVLVDDPAVVVDDAVAPVEPPAKPIPESSAPVDSSTRSGEDKVAKTPASQGGWTEVLVLPKQPARPRAAKGRTVVSPQPPVVRSPRRPARKPVRRVARRSTAQWYQAHAPRYQPLAQRGRDGVAQAAPNVPDNARHGALPRAVSHAFRPGEICIMEHLPCVDVCPRNAGWKGLRNGQPIQPCIPVDGSTETAVEVPTPPVAPDSDQTAEQAEGGAEPQYQCDGPQYHDQPCDDDQAECIPAETESLEETDAAEEACDEAADAAEAAAAQPPVASSGTSGQPIQVSTPQVPAPDAGAGPTSGAATAPPPRPGADEASELEHHVASSPSDRARVHARPPSKQRVRFALAARVSRAPQPAADVRPTPTRSRPRHRAVRAQHVKAAERVTRPHPVADSATALSAGSSTDWFLWFVVALLGAALSTLLVGALSYLQTGAVLTALRRRVGSRGLSATRIALDAEKRPPKKRPSIRYRA